MDITGNVQVYYSDGLGSVRAIADANGNVIETYQTDEFGVPVSTQGSVTQPFRYTGQQQDAEDGFYYLRARMYDPATGRFLSRDRLLGVLSGPSSLNRYDYAVGNPVARTDPSGLLCIGAGFGGTGEAGAVVGAAVSGGLGGAGCAGAPSGVNAGVFAEAGANAGVSGFGASYPKSAPGSVTNGSLGAFAGYGVFGLVSNATSVSQLAGPFEVVQLDVGVGPVKFGAQLAWAGGIWVLSVAPPIPGLTGGAGLAGSHLWTNAWVWPLVGPSAPVAKSNVLR